MVRKVEVGKAAAATLSQCDGDGGARNTRKWWGEGEAREGQHLIEAEKERNTTMEEVDAP
jgi:hypothetical protein